MDNDNTENLTVKLGELGSILAGRVKESVRLYQGALESTASIIPHEFNSLIDTYSAMSHRLCEAVKVLAESDLSNYDSLNNIMTKKMPTPLNITLETYAQVNALRGALGLGLAQLGMSISIQLPLMMNPIDLAKMQAKHKEQSNGISTTPPPNSEERPEVNDDVGPGPAAGQAGGGETGTGPTGPSRNN